MVDFGTVIALLATVLFSGLLTKTLIRYSSALRLVDVPNSRSMHKVSKSRAGGLAIVLSFGAGLLFVLETINPFVVLAFLVVFLLGLYDDVRPSSSKVKFCWLAIAASVLFFGDFGVYTLGRFWGNEIHLVAPLAFALMLIAVVGFVNAMNLIDGLDGLAAGVGVVILGAFVYIGFRFHDPFLFYTSAMLIAALAGFLVFNWHPSRVFMGDTGSLSLGFVIVVLSIHAIHKGYITPVSVLLLTAVPILDTLIVMTRRMMEGKSPFRADRTHIHHILLKQHYGHVRKTVRILILLQLVFTYIGLGFKAKDDVLTLVVFALLFVLFYSMLTPKKSKKHLNT